MTDRTHSVSLQTCERVNDGHLTSSWTNTDEHRRFHWYCVTGYYRLSLHNHCTMHLPNLWLTFYKLLHLLAAYRHTCISGTANNKQSRMCVLHWMSGRSSAQPGTVTSRLLVLNATMSFFRPAAPSLPQQTIHDWMTDRQTDRHEYHCSDNIQWIQWIRQQINVDDMQFVLMKGGTSAGRDESGKMAVWREATR